MTALEVAVGFADVVRFKANTLMFAEPDTQYTISVWAKGTGRIKMYMTANTIGSINMDGAKRIDTDGETEYMELTSTWKRYEATITTDKTVAKNGRVYPCACSTQVPRCGATVGRWRKAAWRRVAAVRR